MSTSPTPSSPSGHTFSEAAMVKKITDLTNTMESIQTFSLWLIHHRKHSLKIAEIWLKELRKERDPKKLLNMVYVANDVVQNSRKKWPLFLEQFLPVFEKGFEHIARYANEKTINSVKRVIQVWRDRQVYTSGPLNQINYAITMNLTSKLLAVWNKDGRTPPAVQSPDWSPSSTTSPASPYDVEDTDTLGGPSMKKAKSDSKEPEPVDPQAPTTAELLDALRQLEEPASADAQIREKIAGFREDVANPALLRHIANAEQADDLYKEIRVAEPIVSDYCKRLSSEIEHRRHTQHLLCEYIKAQKHRSDDMEHLLKEFKKRRDQLNADRIEAYKHYEQLPDLSKLPQSAFLSPLPSAGELFQK